MPWFISAPPPSSAQVPRHRDDGVVVARPEPFHFAGRDERRADLAGLDPPLHLDDIGLQPILEEHAERDAGALHLGEQLSMRAVEMSSGFSTSTWQPARAAAIA